MKRTMRRTILFILAMILYMVSTYDKSREWKVWKDKIAHIPSPFTIPADKHPAQQVLYQGDGWGFVYVLRRSG